MNGREGVKPAGWLGHRDLCPIQWGQPCDCDGGDLDQLNAILCKAAAGGLNDGAVVCLLGGLLAIADDASGTGAVMALAALRNAAQEAIR